MSFDNFDKKIQEAADHHHPAYDENAWNKMEKLLDKHLPQKKDDRRRIIFFIFLFLLLGGGAWLLVAKPWGGTKTIAQLEQTKLANQNTSAPSTTANKLTKPVTLDNNNASVKINSNPDENVNTDNKLSKEINGNLVVGNNNVSISQPIAKNSINQVKQKTNKASKKIIDNSRTVIDDNSKNQNSVNTTISSSPIKDDENKNQVNANEITNPVNDPNSESKETVEKKESTNTENTETKAAITSITENKDDDKTTTTNSSVKKPGKKKNNFFSFSLSAGPDISKVGSSSTGRTTVSYGAGINYTMNRFTLRSGFYVAKKIYDAKGSDYKLSYQLPPNIKLTNVAANCNVFEIPLDLTYDLTKNKKNNFYVGAGLSSYIMKKEKYNYLYTYSSGQTYQRNDAVTNKNKHYFSIANVMAGYTRQLSNKVSVSAEPYIKVPLTGIGAGKVHLNSGGILFTVGIKPFEKKK